MRITADLATERDDRALEAYASVTMAPVLAITEGHVRANDQKLVGVLNAAGPARRDYLWERDRRKRDPLLVQRHASDTVSLRVFPVQKDVHVQATLLGFALTEAPSSDAVRVYRTGLAHLVVVPLTHPTAARADLRDEAGGRALLLLGWRECRKLFPPRVHPAREIPGVDAICVAVRGTGSAAVTDTTVLVALPKGSRAPTDLFVGDVKDAPLIDGGVPPGLREPADPVPPPPPPPTEPRPLAAARSTPASPAS